jgi:UDP-GlcNAc:undecaprenyl-phosphate GlcNAc-1-phosphate transferase
MNYFFFLGILAINFIIIIYYSKITKFINIYDKPDKIRKKHNKPVALISFLFIFLSLLCLIINLSNENSLNYLYSRFKIETNKQFFIFLFSFLSITLIGLYDDKFKISVSTKVALLFFVLYINISIDTGLQVKQIYSIYFNKIFLLDNSSIFFTVFCIFALINAMNMFDGANVQAVIYYLLIFLYFLINGLFVDLSLTLFVPLIFILYLNIKNKIFLGDSGIYAITYLVSYILLKSNNLGNKIAAEEIIFMFLIPGLEMTRLFIYRLSKNTNPFMADTNHFHHILLRKINLIEYLFIICSLILLKFLIIFFFKIYLFYFYILIIILYFYLIIKFSKD